MSLIETLTAWCHGQLHALGYPSATLKPLGGDAGFRQYFRVASEPALLAVYSPPATEPNQQFCDIAEHWRGAGIRAPRIYARDLEQGFLLIEDFGTQALAEVLEVEPVVHAYAPVLDVLARLQQLPAPAGLYPHYDRQKLMAEMALMPEWFVNRLLGISITATDSQLLRGLFKTLAEAALNQPQVIVHRDYHCRNIHRLTTGEPGLIDFQDAVVGPVTYDLVSLLKDCYFRLDAQDVRALALSYRAQLPASLAMSSDDEFLQAFDYMGLQRHIKVLGIFARLNLRDGKPNYLNDLPLVVAYVREVLARYAAFAEVSTWFEGHLMPAISQQSWFRSVAIQP